MELNIEIGVCRCCLTNGAGFKRLSREYDWMGEKEVYADMLRECFDLVLLQPEEAASMLICEICITRLRDSSNFKKQVVYSEKMFVQRLNTEGKKPSVQLKLERFKHEAEEGDGEGPSDRFESHFFEDDDDNDSSDDTKIVQVKPEPSTSTDALESGDDDEPLSSLSTGLKRKSATESAPAAPSKIRKIAPKAPNTVVGKRLTNIQLKVMPRATSKATVQQKAGVKVAVPVKAGVKGPAKIAVPLKTGTGVKVVTKLGVPLRLNVPQKAGQKMPPLKAGQKMPPQKTGQKMPPLKIQAQKPGQKMPLRLGPINRPLKITMKSSSTVAAQKGQMSEEDRTTYKTSHLAGLRPPKLGTYKGKASYTRANSVLVIECSTVCPFKWSPNLGFRCIYCDKQFEEPKELRDHTDTAHKPEKFVNVVKTLGKETPIKVDVTFVKCRICGVESDNLQYLKMHLMNIHDKKFKDDDCMIPFRLRDSKLDELECEVCKKPFKNFILLNKHMNNHYSNYICDICSYGFTSQKAMLQHQKLHVKRSSKCGAQTADKKKNVAKLEKRKLEALIKLRQNPIKEKDINTKANTCILLECSTIVPFKWALCSGFRCFYCNSLFEDPEQLRAHTLNRHSSTEIKPIVRYMTKEAPVRVDITQIYCKLCLKHFVTADDVKKHLAQQHKKTFYDDANYGLLPFKLHLNKYNCVVCDTAHRTFHTLNHHMTKHFGNYICHYCGEGFLTHSILMSHQKRHGEGFKCHICNEVFPTIAKRVTHRRTVHYAEKIKCPQCTETFPDHREKKTHMVKAHGAAHFKYFCQCGKSFLRQRGLSMHTRKDHLNEKNYECDICGEGFFQRYEMVKHTAKHTEDGMKCQVCGLSFKRKRNLEAHESTHNVENILFKI